jgi:hypothetical protein
VTLPSPYLSPGVSGCLTPDTSEPAPGRGSALAPRTAMSLWIVRDAFDAVSDTDTGAAVGLGQRPGNHYR